MGSPDMSALFKPCSVCGKRPIASVEDEECRCCHGCIALAAELAKVKALLLRFSDEVSYVSRGPVHREVLVWRDMLDAKEKASG